MRSDQKRAGAIPKQNSGFLSARPLREGAGHGLRGHHERWSPRLAHSVGKREPEQAGDTSEVQIKGGDSRRVEPFLHFRRDAWKQAMGGTGAGDDGS